MKPRVQKYVDNLSPMLSDRDAISILFSSVSRYLERDLDSKFAARADDLQSALLILLDEFDSRAKDRNR